MGLEDVAKALIFEPDGSIDDSIMVDDLTVHTAQHESMFHAFGKKMEC